jgi:glycosyltransferase involved in cell wall biosynthesis
MRILYDHQAFGQIFGGVSRYYVETIKHLNPEIEREVAVKYSRNAYINDIIPKISYPFGRFYVPFKRRLINKANFNYSISRLINSDYDLFHATFDDSYFLDYVKTPFVISVHDLIPESEPELWQGGWLESRKQVFPRAKHIIANSIHTKNDLLKYYPHLDESIITVIYRGYTPDNFQPIAKKLDKYILFIGSRNGYKNFYRFINACAPILLKEKDLKLICTGNKFSVEEKKMIYRLNITNKVFQKKVNESQLRNLYRNAILFVFPSLKEGFGLPILEAWGNGCPVALSNSGPFPEIAGNAAAYFDPFSIEDIQKCINNLLSDENLRNNLVERGNKRIKLFTWEKSTNEHEMIYNKIYNEAKKN